MDRGPDAAPLEGRTPAPHSPAAAGGGAARRPAGRARRRGARGQALTEFILVFPLFLLLLLGVVQLSLVSFAQQTVHFAAFSAARAAIVRPCMAFHPENDGVDHFTPTVFSAAILATMAAAPAHNLFAGLPYGWLPVLPDTQEIYDLDIGDGTTPVGAPGELALYKYINAATLTTVVRVDPDFGSDPVDWDPLPAGPGPGVPCADWDSPGVELHPYQQSVPPTGQDLSLEVVFLYPMQIPIANRIFYGIFINFSDMVEDELNIHQKIRDPGEPEENVMTMPTDRLPAVFRYEQSVNTLVTRVHDRYRYSAACQGSGTAGVMNARQWFPLPLRARCTLTVEGAMNPLVTFPSW